MCLIYVFRDWLLYAVHLRELCLCGFPSAGLFMAVPKAETANARRYFARRRKNICGPVVVLV